MLKIENVLPARVGSMILKMPFSNQVLVRIVFLQLARHWLLFFENHKIQVYGHFGSAGRNARGRWGRLLRGLEICRDEIASGVGRCGFWFGFDTPALAYGKGGGSLRAFRRAHPRTMKIEVFFGNFRIRKN